MKTKIAAILALALGFGHNVIAQSDWKPATGVHFSEEETTPQYYSRVETVFGADFEFTDKGARITNVNPNTPADESGFKVGDVVTTIGSVAIISEATYKTAMETYKPDETVKVAYVRNGSQKQKKVTLAKLTVYKKAGTK